MHVQRQTTRRWTKARFPRGVDATVESTVKTEGGGEGEEIGQQVAEVGEMERAGQVEGAEVTRRSAETAGY